MHEIVILEADEFELYVNEIWSRLEVAESGAVDFGLIKAEVNEVG